MRKIGPPPYIPGLSDRLRELITVSGYTQSKVASSCGRERKTVIHWLGDVSTPDAYCLMCLCNFFHVSADYLLGIDKRDKVE